jgi:hypothetical protein
LADEISLFVKERGMVLVGKLFEIILVAVYRRSQSTSHVFHLWERMEEEESVETALEPKGWIWKCIKVEMSQASLGGDCERVTGISRKLQDREAENEKKKQNTE